MVVGVGGADAEERTHRHIITARARVVWITSDGVVDRWDGVGMDELMDGGGKPVIPGYEVIDRLGAGGAGEVWVVRRPDGIRLAAKLIHSSHERTVGEEDFLRRLDHDHVVRLRDTVREEGGDERTVLILDLAEGGSLADAIEARRTLTPGELVTVLTPIARTLHDLHGSGLVHADISSGNILFTDAGKPLLADLGVARLAGSYDDTTWATDAWAAPEVLAGQPAGPASDVYALGAVAWACVTGTPPPPLLQRPELQGVASHLDGSVIELINEAMSFDPEERPSAGEFALRLWRCAEARPAPVAGSRGSRRVADAQEPVLLTRRMIRAAKAVEDAETDPEPSLRSRFASKLPARHALFTGAGAALVTSVVATGVWALVPDEPTYATGHVDPSTPTSAPPAVQQPSAAAPPAAKLVPKPAVALKTPSQIVSDLVAARARAWNQEDPQLLVHALAPNSPADKADRTALATAQRQGADYGQVRFDVGQVSVTKRSASRMTVITTVQRPDYVVTTASVTHDRPANSQRVTLELVRSGQSWLIHSWR